MNRAWKITLVVALVLFGLPLAGGWWVLRTQAGHDWLAATLPKLARTPGLELSIGRLEGALPGSLTLDRMSLADDNGVWLTLEGLRVDWSPLALLAGRLTVATLHVERLDFARAPALPTTPAAASAEPLRLPELPLALSVADLRIEQLQLGEALAGQAARIRITANAHTAPSSGSLSATLQAERLDGVGGQANLRLNLDPAAQLSDLDLRLQEPSGGLVASLLQLAGSPPVAITLAGQGTLADWAGEMAITAGPDVQFGGPLRMIDQNTLTLDWSGLLTGLVPFDVQPLIAGTTHLQLTAALSGSDIALPQMQLQTAAGTLAGALALRGDGLSGTLTLTSTDPLPWQKLTGQVLPWSKIDLTASLSGTVAEPAIAATVQTDGLDLTAVDANAALLVGPTPTLSLTAHLHPAEAQIDIADLLLTFAVGTVDGNAALRQWGQQGDFALSLALPHLNSLAPLTGLAMGGSATLDLIGAYDPANGLLATLHSQTEKLTSGQLQLDRLLGPAPKLLATVAVSPAGNLAVSDLAFTAHALTLAGRLGVDDAGLDADLAAELTDLAALDAGLRGRVKLTLVGGGTPANPQAQLSVRGEGLRVNGAGVGRAQLDSRVAWDGQTLKLTTINGHALGLALSGAVSLDAARVLATGRLNAEMTDWAALKQLAGINAAGAVGASLALTPNRGRQSATLSLTATDLQAEGASIAGLSLEMAIADLLGQPALQAKLTSTDLRHGATLLSSVAATLNGPLNDLAWSIDTAMAAPQKASLKGNGRGKIAGTSQSLAINTLALTLPDGALRLLRPATLQANGQNFSLPDLAVSGLGLNLTAKGQLAAKGAIEAQLDGKLDSFTALSKLAGITAPRGSASLSLTLTGTRNQPALQAQLALKNLGLPQAVAGLPGVDVDAALNWNGQVANATATLQTRQRQGVRLDAEISLPLGVIEGLPSLDMQAPLKGRANGQIDLALLGDALAASGDRTGGRLALDVTVSGQLVDPHLAGAIDLTAGRYDSAITGVRLRNIVGRIVGTGSELRIETLTAQTAASGQLAISGGISLAGAQGPVVDVRLTANNAVLADTDLIRLTAGGDLRLSGPLDGLGLAGLITVSTAEITVPEKLPPSVVVLDYQEVGGSYRTSPKATATVPAPPLDIALKLDIDFPGRVFARGRGLDAELGGKIAIAGTSRAPIVTGGLSLRRGTLAMLGNSYSFTRGTIDFTSGSLIPELDLLAEAQASDAKVGIAVEGPASAPSISLTSDPELPQDEMLARLVFGKPTGALSALESVQLARSAAELAGIGGGPGLVNSVRRGLQLDRLEITGGSDGTGTGGVTAGRYLNERVFVGVEQQFGGTGAATVEVEITDDVKLNTRVGGDGSARVGITYQQDY